MSKTAIIKFRDFSGGLVFGAPPDELPANAVVRNRGARPGRRKQFSGRLGSDGLAATNSSDSIVRYNDEWYHKSATTFYRGIQALATTASRRLSFLKMPPTAGIQDYLFAVDGATPIKLGDDIYTSGTELVTNGTMETGVGPDNWTDYGTPSTSEQSTEQVHSGSYSNKITVDAANEGTQSDDFTTVDYTRYRVRLYVFPDDTTAVTVKIRHGDDSGWLYDEEHTGLTQDAWNEISFNTDGEGLNGGAGAYIVVESGDDTSGTYYIDNVSIQAIAETVSWGIEPPANYITVAEGAAGNLSGTYQYGMTYLNSVTGTRSNSPSTGDTTDTKLLLHMEGATTSFSDSSVYTQTVTAAGDATQSDVAAKFGSKSLLLDGTGDYITVTYDASLDLGSQTFCIEGWVRFDTVAGGETCRLVYIDQSGYHLEFGAYIASATTLYVGFLYGYGSDSFWIYADTPFTVAADTWYHMAVVRGWNGDPNKFAVLFDGAVGGTTTSNASITLNSNDINIGDAHDGYIDEVRITIGDPVYRTTFTPSTTAFAIFPSIDVTAKKVSISAIPESDDPQVDIIELWRTVGDGSVLFKLVEIPNGTTTYTDNTDDDYLSNTELPVDNIQPFQYFTDCFGPYNASAFWLADATEGQRGRVFYSAVGRAEAMQGYIEVSGDDLPLKKGCVWQGYIYVFGEDGIYQVYGSNPYYSRKVDPVGIAVKETLAVTPMGICYEAEDGPRIFDGNRSQLLGKGTVEFVFRGEAHGQLTSFTGVSATYGRGEYYITSGTQTIACDLEDVRWRDLGLALTAVYYAEDSDQLAGGHASYGLLDVEKEGENDDYGNAMALALETSHVRIAASSGGIVKQVHIDHDSSNETLTVYLVHDGTATAIGTAASASRERDTLQANTYCREFGIRITGSVDAQVDIFGIDVELYLPNEEEL